MKYLNSFRDNGQWDIIIDIPEFGWGTLNDTQTPAPNKVLTSRREIYITMIFTSVYILHQCNIFRTSPSWSLSHRFLLPYSRDPAFRGEVIISNIFTTLRLNEDISYIRVNFIGRLISVYYLRDYNLYHKIMIAANNMLQLMHILSRITLIIIYLD